MILVAIVELTNYGEGQVDSSLLCTTDYCKVSNYIRVMMMMMMMMVVVVVCM